MCVGRARVWVWGRAEVEVQVVAGVGEAWMVLVWVDAGGCGVWVGVRVSKAWVGCGRISVVKCGGKHGWSSGAVVVVVLVVRVVVVVWGEGVRVGLPWSMDSPQPTRAPQPMEPESLGRCGPPPPHGLPKPTPRGSRSLSPRRGLPDLSEWHGGGQNQWAAGALTAGIKSTRSSVCEKPAMVRQRALPTRTNQPPTIFRSRTGLGACTPRKGTWSGCGRRPAFQSVRSPEPRRSPKVAGSTFRGPVAQSPWIVRCCSPPLRHRFTAATLPLTPLYDTWPPVRRRVATATPPLRRRTPTPIRRRSPAASPVLCCPSTAAPPPRLPGRTRARARARARRGGRTALGPRRLSAARRGSARPPRSKSPSGRTCPGLGSGMDGKAATWQRRGGNLAAIFHQHCSGNGTGNRQQRPGTNTPTT